MFLVNTLQSWTLCNCICRRVDPKQYVVLVLGEGVSKICLNIHIQKWVTYREMSGILIYRYVLKIPVFDGVS